MDKNQRIVEIDIIKAIGIIMMVAGHAEAPFTRFLYLFHMAIFIIASGFCYKKTVHDFNSLINQIKKKIQQLWLPLFIWNIIFVLLHNWFITINVYTDNQLIMTYGFSETIVMADKYDYFQMLVEMLKGCFLVSTQQIFGASWFLRVLFIISIVYLLVDYLALYLGLDSSTALQNGLSIILLIVGYYCYLNNFHFINIESVFSCYWLYHVGYMLRRIVNTGEVSWKRHAISLVASFLCLIVMNRIGAIAINNNSYKNPIFFVICSLAGWLFVYSAAFYIKHCALLKNIMVFIGRRTLAILILHFLAFKIVEAAIVIKNGLPLFCIAVFPNIYGYEGCTWLVYTIVGSMVPVAMSVIYEEIKALVNKRRRNKNVCNLTQ